jgi:type I restriction enzyme S subunit
MTLFRLAAGWELKRLDAIGTIHSGSTPSTANAAYWNGEIVWITPHDLSMLHTRNLTESSNRITNKGLQACSARLLPANSIVISSRAPIGYVALPTVEFCTNQGCKSIKLRRNYHPDFAYYNILFNAERLRHVGEGTTFAEISKSALSKVEIAFPTSLIEQAKIAEVLDKADHAIFRTEAMVAKRRRIRLGLTNDLLRYGIDKNGTVRSDRTHAFKESICGKIPSEWIVQPLGDVADIIDPNPSHRYPPSSDWGVPIASTENFEGENDFDLVNCDTVPIGVYESQYRRCKYQASDVIFARKGRIGLARPYGNEKKVFSHTIVIIKSKNPKQAINEFLLWVVRAHAFFVEIDKRMNSNSGVPTLGVQFLARVPIRLPKVDEQERIVSVLAAAEANISKERAALEKLQVLKAGLMQDLLTGRKRVTALLDEELRREKAYA